MGVKIQNTPIFVFIKKVEFMAYKNKYQQEKQQYSVDGGTTWIDVTPPNYRKGRLLAVGHNGDDCNEPVIYDGDYLTTEILGNGSIEMAKITRFTPMQDEDYPTYPLTDIAYSKNDGEWVAIDYFDTITVTTGDKIRWKAIGYESNNVVSTGYIAQQSNNSDYLMYGIFSVIFCTAEYKVYGNPKSLLYGDNFENVDETNKTVQFIRLFTELGNIYNQVIDAEGLYIPTNMANYCCWGMFESSKLITPPVLSSTDLTRGCYERMFNSCKWLTSTPTLPATTLARGCYEGMFMQCESITTPPQLPATNLATYCYNNMFYFCKNLSTTPTLPATTLFSHCYDGMFTNTGITSTPELPSTNLADYCYKSMFSYCENLMTTTTLSASRLANYCYSEMFFACTRLANAPQLPATNLADHCYDLMFSNCTSLVTTPTLPATTLANYCYWGMFDGCTSLYNVTALPANNLMEGCYQIMFRGCTRMTDAPQLPATTAAINCYREMFSNCTSLRYINCKLLYFAQGSTTDWVSGVPTSGGTFIYKCLNENWTSGVNGYPSDWIRTCTN